MSSSLYYLFHMRSCASAPEHSSGPPSSGGGGGGGPTAAIAILDLLAKLVSTCRPWLPPAQKKADVENKEGEKKEAEDEPERRCEKRGYAKWRQYVIAVVFEALVLNTCYIQMHAGLTYYISMLVAMFFSYRTLGQLKAWSDKFMLHRKSTSTCKLVSAVLMITNTVFYMQLSGC